MRAQICTFISEACIDICSYIVLPFVNKKAEDFAFRLKKLIQTNYPKVDFNVAFKSPKTIGNLFPFKDQIKEDKSKSLVVYRITCKTCNKEYIGKTERILAIRMNEHQKNKSSSCYQHTIEHPSHEMDYENVQVIDRARSDFKLKMKELLHILNSQPELNKQMNAQSDFEIRTLIIPTYPQHQQQAN